MDKLYVENYKDGRFRFVFRFYDPITNKMRRVTCVKDKNTRQVYNEALRELQDKAYSTKLEALTIKEVTEYYFNDKSRILKPQTLLRNKSIIYQVNERIGNDVLIEQLNVRMLKNALLDLSVENVTYNEKLKRYKAFLNWCYENEYIENTFWIKLHCLPDNKKQRIEQKYLEPEELTALLDDMDLPLWYYVTYFLVLSGLRIGELICLKDKDVNDYIKVDKTYELSTKGVGTTKTMTSTREVFVQKELEELIKKIRHFQKEYRFMHGVKSDLFICGSDGSYISYNAFRQYLKDHSERVVGRAITPHALRHTSASLLLAQGVPLETVSRRLGHANSNITKDIYIHITSKMKKKEEEMLQEVKII